MRLDKYLSESGIFSRSEAGKAIRSGRIAVDGTVLRDPSKHIAESASVTCDGKPVVWSRYQYIMLHKPAGYVSATEDKGRTVMDLVPPACTRLGMFPCGRLDIDTTGLLLITNDGPGAIMSPKPTASPVPCPFRRMHGSAWKTVWSWGISHRSRLRYIWMRPSPEKSPSPKENSTRSSGCLLPYRMKSHPCSASGSGRWSWMLHWNRASGGI